MRGRVGGANLAMSDARTSSYACAAGPTAQLRTVGPARFAERRSVPASATAVAGGCYAAALAVGTAFRPAAGLALCPSASRMTSG